jgi:hypothetical protein
MERAVLGIVMRTAVLAVERRLIRARPDVRRVSVDR